MDEPSHGPNPIDSTTGWILLKDRGDIDDKMNQKIAIWRPATDERGVPLLNEQGLFKCMVPITNPDHDYRGSHYFIQDKKIGPGVAFVSSVKSMFTSKPASTPSSVSSVSDASLGASLSASSVEKGLGGKEEEESPLFIHDDDSSLPNRGISLPIIEGTKSLSDASSSDLLLSKNLSSANPLYGKDGSNIEASHYKTPSPPQNVNKEYGGDEFLADLTGIFGDKANDIGQQILSGIKIENRSGENFGKTGMIKKPEWYQKFANLLASTPSESTDVKSSDPRLQRMNKFINSKMNAVSGSITDKVGKAPSVPAPKLPRIPVSVELQTAMDNTTISSSRLMNANFDPTRDVGKHIFKITSEKGSREYMGKIVSKINKPNGDVVWTFSFNKNGTEVQNTITTRNNKEWPKFYFITYDVNLQGGKSRRFRKRMKKTHRFEKRGKRRTIHLAKKHAGKRTRRG
jgi:hypothetical protein